MLLFRLLSAVKHPKKLGQKNHLASNNETKHHTLDETHKKVLVKLIALLIPTLCLIRQRSGPYLSWDNLGLNDFYVANQTSLLGIDLCSNKSTSRYTSQVRFFGLKKKKLYIHGFESLIHANISQRLLLHDQSVTVVPLSFWEAQFLCF
jgi:hypothetical protein